MDSVTALFCTVFRILLGFLLLFARKLLEPKIISTPEIVVDSTLVGEPILEEIFNNSFLKSLLFMILTPDNFMLLVELDFITLDFIV